MKKIAVKNIVWKEGKYYVAWCLNVNVSSFGSTKKEALSSLKEALELYFENQPVNKKATRIGKPDIVSLIVAYA